MLRLDPASAFPVAPACPSFSAMLSGRSLEGSSLTSGQEGSSGLPGSAKGEGSLHLPGDQLLAPHGFSSPGWICRHVFHVLQAEGALAGMGDRHKQWLCSCGTQVAAA